MKRTRGRRGTGGAPQERQWVIEEIKRAWETQERFPSAQEVEAWISEGRPGLLRDMERPA